ncbi:MAG: polysulfide reductase NrfD, partial [Hydrogenophilaceae bacterium]|nr:polysulfide reductase NrfD [Hydrogenophilaceae bacterium]
NLLGVFIAASLYFVFVYHITNLYFTKHHGLEAFILMDGGIHTLLFWVGQVVLGYLLPMAILFHPGLGNNRGWIALASVLAILGGLAQMYVTIIGGQAYPIEMFPGYKVSSSFYDGVVHAYNPSLLEVMLGLGGVAVSLIMVAFAIKVLRFLPERLDDETVAALHGAK